ncbi:MAG: M4 family metallopeptidase [Syntrophobacteraceae bacterium]
MKSSRTARTSFTLIALALFMAALFQPGIGAAQTLPENVRPEPILSTSNLPSVATPVRRMSAPTQGRDAAGAELLKTRLQAIAETQSGSASSKKALGDAARSRAWEQSRATVGQSLKANNAGLQVSYRPFVGTPREIRAAAGATSDGRAVKLRAAMEGMVSGRERDEMTSRAFLRERAGLLRLSDPDEEMQLEKYWEDDLGRRHLRYSQQYKGMPVWPAELNVHLDAEGNVDLVNGAYVGTPKRLVCTPVLTEARAEAIAEQEVPDGASDARITSELIVYAPGSGLGRLSWKVRVLGNAASDWVVVVDALNGNVLTAFNQVKTGAATGSGADLLNTTRSLNLWSENSKYYLLDASKAMYDASSDPPSADSTKGAIFVLDMAHNELPSSGSISASYVTSTSATSGWLKDGVSMAYNLSKTYDYYKNVHGRNSIDGQGGNIMGFVRVGSNFNNAFWTTEYNAVFFGDAKIYAAALDVVGHEITHGVTSYTCNLVYQDQSGALNEAFSDIFGEMVEAYATGSTDWIDGTVFNESTSRSLKNPSSVQVISGYNYYYPSKMSEFYNRNSPLLQMLQDQDYGGVHINMTIVSHAFYLLAEGLNGAIGREKASKIFYRAQTVHLVTNSQFVDMRLACIQSAEELYGSGSTEASKVAEAFDAVEIVDSSGTPDPDPTPAVSGDDSYIFVSYDPSYYGYYLARRETALGDGQYGNWLSYYKVDQARPSVSGDGDTAFFTDYYSDACFITTAGGSAESCLGMSYQIHSVAMSPDEEVYGFVLLDYYGNPTDKITVVDLRPGGETRQFNLAAPGTEGYTVQTVVYADAMDFTADNRYLVYDAYNILKLSDGTTVGAWSIYAIDLVTEQTFALVPPVPGYDIGYPSLSQVSNHLMTWDLYSSSTGASTVVASNLITGESKAVGSVSGDYGAPCYNGDASAIAYGQVDYAVPTAHSIYLRQLSSDGITPTGSAAKDLADAEFGVIYRRGTFSTPVPDIAVSPATLAFGNVATGATGTLTVQIDNNGYSDLTIQNLGESGSAASMFAAKGSCLGQTLPAGGSCSVLVEFTPTSIGTKTATLAISSNDPDSGTVNVSLSGTGINSNDKDGDGVPDSQDAFPDDPQEWLDTDHDGIGNNADMDDDGDGFSDAYEVQKGTDPLSAASHPARPPIGPVIDLLLSRLEDCGREVAQFARGCLLMGESASNSARIAGIGSMHRNN